MTAELPADAIAMIARGVSVIVASRDERLRPSVMRAVGSRIAPDGREITVYLSRPQSRQLLLDLAASGHIAVVFSEPSTHRSLQVKATRVQTRDAHAQDQPVLAAYLASMERELQAIGFPAGMAAAMLQHRLQDLVAVRFTPEQAFDQTPGPKAGAALGSAR
jgi:hypothetical protein